MESLVSWMPLDQAKPTVVMPQITVEDEHVITENGHVKVNEEPLC
jgi:hypothetical protein